MQYYRWINLLNMDVAAGAVAGGLFFARWLAVKVPVAALFCLATTVWMIYTIDRILDVRKMKKPAASERHRFHQKHQRWLLILLLVGLLINLILLFYLPTDIIKNGAILMGFVCLYLIIPHRLLFVKEFFVAGFYVSGVLLPAGSLRPIAADHYLPVIAYFLLALTNLLLFSYIERVEDKIDRLHSFARLTSDRLMRITITGLVFITTAMALLIGLHWDSALGAVFLLMSIALSALLFFESHFSKQGYYRMWGDFVFLLPLLYLLFE
jgi:hypothetical protein